MAIDPYRTLGLEPGATPAEVKRAYRRLAKAFHPDSAGEAALPRFLAIHEAYDQLTTGRRPASGGRAGSAAPSEPWRADPARARAAREQARSRRPRPAGASAGAGASPGSPAGDGPRRRAGSPPAGPGPGASRPGSAGRTTGTGGAARGAGGAARNSPGAASGSSAGGAASARPGGRRRTVRKATPGSTSYDEARDPVDPTWAGAAWYGPTSGEYWTVNPREYADPRKHGPEYQSRARRGATSAAGAESGSQPGAEAGAYRQAGPAAAGRAWTPPRFAESAEAAASPDRGPAEPRTIVPPASLASFLGSDLGDPVRRLGFVLLAWAPLGVASAAIIGQVTGCASYSASCGATEPLLPWLAQAIILGVLLLVPALSRILATGTIALVLALVPIAGVFVGFGGAGQTEGSVLLVVLLTAAWVAGVAVAVRSAWRSRAGAASP